MRAWLLTVGEPLPIDPGATRLWRTGLLADSLIARGHDVVWWTSAFDHFQRRLREPVDSGLSVKPGLTVWQLSGVPYGRNVSIARLRNHHQVARRFSALAATQPQPDVVLSSLPTLELCDAAVAFGRSRSVPIAIDIRDLWPDVIFEMLPQPVRAVAPYAAPWMRRQLKRSASGAAAILGVTDEFVRWGLDHAGRERSQLDRAFPMGYSGRTPDDDDRRRADASWDAYGLRPDQFVICFFGTLGWMFDFDTVLAAAAMLQEQAPNVRFVICGGGENLGTIRERSSALTNVIVTGAVGFAEIWTLMRRSAAGLAPYRAMRNFSDNLPNKPIEYLSAGLPIIGADLRVLRRLLFEQRCGVTYANGSATELAQCVMKLRADAGLRSAMSARSSELYKRNYVAERVYADMAMHLEQVAVPSAADNDLGQNSHSTGERR